MDNLIISGGENIYPQEVEFFLSKHPSIADVAVCGVADEKWGQVVKALIVRRTPALTAEDVDGTAWRAASCRATSGRESSSSSMPCPGTCWARSTEPLCDSINLAGDRAWHRRRSRRSSARAFRRQSTNIRGSDTGSAASAA